MAKRTMMIMAFALISSVFAAGAFAQWTISGGLAVSTITDITVKVAGIPDENPSIDPGVGIGGNIYADRLLPISIPLSLGFEIGVDTASFKSDSGRYTDTVTTIPLLARVAYHFDLMAKLDLYVVGKIGYAIGFWEGDSKKADEKMGISITDKGGIAFGFDVGAAYYLSPTFGLFAEIGFDRYLLESEGSGTVQGYNVSATLEAPFQRWLTVGVSFKIDAASSGE
jgi:hypothetical protein